jgi:pantothenate kinase
MGVFQPYAGYRKLVAGDVKAVLDRVAAARLTCRGRLLVAIAGPPGAGKSTLAAKLAGQIPGAAVVPMDGFHLDNAVLVARGLSARKGAPDTFDVAGLAALLPRLRQDAEVVIPLFDRAHDTAIAGAAVIGPRDQVVLIEGNYLLLNDAPWASLQPHWDVTVALEVPLATLEARLIRRWRDHGLTQDQAQARAQGNDLANARLVNERSAAAEITVRQA